MEIPSFKNLWRPGLPKPGDYVRQMRSLLENVPLEQEEGEAAELTQFRNEIANLAKALDERSSSEELHSTIATALESLKKFNLVSAKRVSGHLTELKTVMRSMTETITFLSESRTTVVHQLNFIERQLEQASELEDIRLLQPKLLNCLVLVREETARLQSESAAHTELVRSKVGVQPNFSEPPRRVGSLDPATGLPGRQIAEQLLRDKIAAGKECTVAIFLPNRLASINRHHGRGVGDEVLLHVAQHLAKVVQPPASLCRWSGPAFIAFVESPGKFAEVSRAWKELAARPCDKTIESGRRSVLLPITISVFTTSVTATSDAQSLFDEFEHYVMENTGDTWTG